MIPDAVIDQVRDAHDIVDIVSRFTPLKRKGSAFKALCPLQGHDEKTPSFTVNPNRQIYKCFGCGRGGNVFRFLMEMQGLTFVEAVRALGEERGIALPTQSRFSGPPPDRKRKTLRALSLAQRYFHACLGRDEGTVARAYLNKRGYDSAAIRTFGLGYAPASRHGLLHALTKRGVDEQSLVDAGLIYPREGSKPAADRFVHRVMFPVANLQGQVVTFGGRALNADERAKYLNGPETLVFRKSQTLYALERAQHAIRKRGEALVMEGYTDVLMCHMHGFEHAVAGMGTAFTPQQARLIHRFASRAMLLYDADDAGQKAAERAVEVLLEAGLEVRVVVLPRGRDVDEILLEDGEEALDRILTSALNLFDYKILRLGQEHDLRTPRGRARAVEALVPTIVRVRSPVEREQLFRHVSEKIGGDLEQVTTERLLRAEAARVVQAEQRMARSRSRSRANRSSPTGRRGGGRPEERGNESAAPALTDGERTRLQSRARDERDLLGACFVSSSLLNAVTRAMGPEHFALSVHRRVFAEILETVDAGRSMELHGLLKRFVGDPEASSVLTALPDDAALAERVAFQIEFVERDRLRKSRFARLKSRLRAGAEGAVNPELGESVRAIPVAHEAYPSPAPEAPPDRDGSSDALASDASLANFDEPVVTEDARPSLGCDAHHPVKWEIQVEYDQDGCPVLDGPPDDAEAFIEGEHDEQWIAQAPISTPSIAKKKNTKKKSKSSASGVFPGDVSSRREDASVSESAESPPSANSNSSPGARESS